MGSARRKSPLPIFDNLYVLRHMVRTGQDTATAVAAAVTAAGGSVVLLLTLNEFGIVLFTGAKGVITLPVLIYTRGIVTFDLPGAAAA